MKFATIFSALLAFVALVTAREINLLKLACDVKITEIEAPADMIPAVITPDNFSQLILALKCCKIDRAQVAGWNDTKGTFVLYSNGAVVPAESLTLPNVALFFTRCKCPAARVICVVNPDDPRTMRCYEPCATITERVTCCGDSSSLEECPCPGENPAPCGNPAACEAPCYEPCHPPYSSPPVCNPPTCIQECVSESSCELECEPNCPPPIERRSRSRKETPCGTETTRRKTSRTFVFQERIVNCKKVPILKVISKERRLKEQTIDLCNPDTRLTPSCLQCPDILYKMKRQIEKRLGSPVGLYVTMSNKVYARAGSRLFRAKIVDAKLVIEEVGRDCIPPIVCRGLFGVKFVRDPRE